MTIEDFYKVAGLLGAYGFASEGLDAEIWQWVVAGVLGFFGVGALLNAIASWRGVVRA